MKLRVTITQDVDTEDLDYVSKTDNESEVIEEVKGMFKAEAEFVGHTNISVSVEAL